MYVKRGRGVNSEFASTGLAGTFGRDILQDVSRRQKSDHVAAYAAVPEISVPRSPPAIARAPPRRYCMHDASICALEWHAFSLHTRRCLIPHFPAPNHTLRQSRVNHEARMCRWALFSRCRACHAL